MNRKRKESVRLQIEDSSLMMDSELVPSSLAEIAPILRAANYIQKENPRVAYLCRFYAFEKAHSMDPTSGRRGARQFKTKLLHRLVREEEDTRLQLPRSDSREIQLFYQIFCENYINKVAHTKKLDEMAKIWQIATILYDVVKTMVPSAKIDVKTHKYAEDIWSKREQFEPYNILPLNATCAKSAIMELPEIKAALYALRNVQKLPRCRVHSTPKIPGALPDERDKPVVDILDWLSHIFGFQVYCALNSYFPSLSICISHAIGFG
ncbi:hypothetical protein Patl1_07848 [Pistacia atlantica]|uniref:Uncharacterized protein n=1 Tax=Pistacia atlantica TaxID=434234 RepID=A0ACC1ADC9_9ROSI|nr:hypothetical protein Patl1_07848 [Pistacia atlantica]